VLLGHAVQETAPLLDVWPAGQAEQIAEAEEEEKVPEGQILQSSELPLPLWL